MKKVLVAVLIVAVAMMALAIPAFADEGDVPHHGASLGKWRHTQAPGQGGCAPGELGGTISERASGEEGGLAWSISNRDYTPSAPDGDPHPYP
jgi:hypothetical protein